MKLQDDEIICDKCEHYRINPSCTCESCWQNLENPHYMTTGYFEDRIKGEKLSCKAFTKVRKEF